MKNWNVGIIAGDSVGQTLGRDLQLFGSFSQRAFIGGSYGDYGGLLKETVVEGDLEKLSLTKLRCSGKSQSFVTRFRVQC